MDQLLSISSTLGKVGINTTQGYMTNSHENASFTINRQDGGGLQMKGTLAKVEIDQTAAFDSVNPSLSKSIDNFAREGHQAADAATQKYTNEGEMYRKAQIGEDVLQKISESTLNVNTNVGIEFLPTTGPKFNYIPGELEIDFKMDELKFDWKVQQGELDYTPAEVSIHMEQEPDINIEYLGGPTYVPSSSKL